jgi:hypothetical protein
MLSSRVRRLVAGVAVGSLFALAAASPASAVAVLHFEDDSLGTSAVPGALSSLGLVGSTTFTSDVTTFNTLLDGGGWDLVIFGEQNSFDTFDDASGSLTPYVTGGGRLIATTWRDGGLGSLLEAVFVTSNAAQITTDAHPIFAGLGATIDLDNPGWGTFSISWGPTGSAVGLGSLGAGAAAILGNDGRTILNGPLFDTFDDLAQGEDYIANQIAFLLAVQQADVPEPGTLALVGLGVVLLGCARRRKTRVLA